MDLGMHMEHDKTPAMTSPDHLRQVVLPSGIELAVQDTEQGERAMVWVHGMGSSHRAWARNLPAFRKHYRCIAFDWPNYGGSSKGAFPFTMSFFSQVLQDLIATLQLENPILVGHSMGGQAVLRTLVDQPELSSTAILVAPAGLETFDAQEIAWLGRKYTPENIARLSPEQVRHNWNLNFFQFPPDAEFMVAETMAARSGPHFQHYCEMIPKSVLGMVNDRVQPLLPGIRADVLIAFGLQDELIPHPVLHKAQSTRELAEQEVPRIPRAELLLLDQCGHFLQWEQAELFNQEVENFLQSRGT